MQERLTREIASAIWEAVSPAGVGVVVEAKHMCMVNFFSFFSSYRLTDKQIHRGAPLLDMSTFTKCEINHKKLEIIFFIFFIGDAWCAED